MDCFWSSYFSNSDIGYILMEIWDEVIKHFNDELNRLRNVLSDGNAETYAHYKQLVGHILGIVWSRQTFTSIVKSRIYEEEE